MNKTLRKNKFKCFLDDILNVFWMYLEWSLDILLDAMFIPKWNNFMPFNKRIMKKKSY